MITEDYVGFETAKLLKEKGFDEPCDKKYFGDDCSGPSYIRDSWEEGGDVCPTSNSNLDDGSKYTDVSAPTLQMAMKWLREVYNLFISISIWLRHKDGTVQYYYEIRNLNNKDFETIAGTTIAEFDSPEKTYEAAIMCCLKNLI